MNIKLYFFSLVFLGLSSITTAQETSDFSTEIFPRIIGGEVANPDAWPWIAALVLNEYSLYQGQFCAGTLIHPKWVLTAAHCVDWFTGEIPFKVVLGIHDLSTDVGEYVSIQRIIIHPNYDNLGSDMALLELEHTVSYTPIDLPDNNTRLDDAGTMATIIGWGNTSMIKDNPIFLNELRQVTLPIVSSHTCNTIYNLHSISITNNMLCAGFIEGGKDSCQGDSGGPLMVMDNQDGHWKQMGIVNFGLGCALANTYGVYARISALKDFINQYVCQVDTPVITLQIDAYKRVTLSWSAIMQATGYEIYYAPYPIGFPIQSFNVGNQIGYSVTLETGNAFYVAVKSYNQACKSDFSTIHSFIIP